ncbi:MAG TPA: amidohydrolase family protein [Bryobacteraceae bacterium]|jgi:predicted TIM-barrel fold metal-dependent hydrolase|nr:amidohydrolase family protein [Bryobacteraceae bacterium]
MRSRASFLTAGVVFAFVLVTARTNLKAAEGDVAWSADFAAFTAMEPIDTHAHAFKVDPQFYAFLRKLHVHLLDIVVANKDDEAFPTLEPKIAAAQAFVKNSHGQAVLCTTFDPFQFSSPKFSEDAIGQLNRDFAVGAVAVKIWKNVGMELKDASGHFVLPDDPRLKPIYEDIASHGKTLIAHLAEPNSCWLPPNKNSPDYSYYTQHPEWYMYNQSDHPKKATILQARDHILEQNPQLRVVGAHLGSMEMDLDGLGKRFDRYPNFAVDVAARVAYLAIQPREKVRQFLIKYQDRIVYGTDLSLSERQSSEAAAKTWAKHYTTDWTFFSTSRTLEYEGHTAQGLELPGTVLHKLYHDNAVRWIPGVLP